MLYETESLGLRLGRREEADAVGQKKRSMSQIENHRDLLN